MRDSGWSCKSGRPSEGGANHVTSRTPGRWSRPVLTRAEIASASSVPALGTADLPARFPEDHSRLSSELFEWGDPQRLSRSFEIRDLGREPCREEVCCSAKRHLIATGGGETRRNRTGNFLRNVPGESACRPFEKDAKELPEVRGVCERPFLPRWPARWSHRVSTTLDGPRGREPVVLPEPVDWPWWRKTRAGRLSVQK